MAEPDQIFRWKYANVFIALFWGMAVAMLSIGVGVEERDLWFILTYLFSIAATLWSIGAWLTSDVLGKRLPTTWNRQRRKRATKKDWRSYAVWKWTATGALIALLVFVLLVARSLQIKLELNALSGRLYPGNEESPKNACGVTVDQDTLMLFLGSMIAIPKTFPATVIRVNGYNLLTLDRNDDGSLAVSLEIRSPDGKIIVLMKDGEFLINQNNFLSKHRKDRSSLEVIDQNGSTALSMRFLNPQAMWIDATFSGVGFRGSVTGSKALCTTNPGQEPMFDMKMSDKEIYLKSILGVFPYSGSN
jgi:hypothetical protein